MEKESGQHQKRHEQRGTVYGGPEDENPKGEITLERLRNRRGEWHGYGSGHKQKSCETYVSPSILGGKQKDGLRPVTS
jgi:hypothetical protein